MNQSKNIFERIRLYRINSRKNSKKNKQEEIMPKDNNVVEQKKPFSKIKNFFKTIFGLFIGFFEYLVMKSNEKNSTKNNINKHTENIIIKQELNVETKKEYSNNINQKKVEQIQKKETYSTTKNIEIKNVEVLENSKNIELIFPKKLVKKKAEIRLKEIKKEELLQEKKNKLILIEEDIIYANSLEELDISKRKVLDIKNSLINEKSNNEIKKENINVINNSKNEKSETLHELDRSIDINSVIELNELAKEKEDVDKEKKLTEQQLITRCDEDLVLIEEKKKKIEFQEQYEKKVNEIAIKKDEFRITKKDLKQIKNYVDSILRKQQQNFDNLKLYMNTQSSTKLFMARLNNCLKSTAKLSLSFIPFFSFPNKLLGLVTSSLFINSSLKSYRFKPNKNYLNQNIKVMINSYESCLKSGIRLCEDSLNEIDNIKYYLNILPSNVKDTYEYRKYFIDVISTEKQVKTQIQTLNKFSKNYNDIKVKVKKREY